MIYVFTSARKLHARNQFKGAVSPRAHFFAHNKKSSEIAGKTIGTNRRHCMSEHK